MSNASEESPPASSPWIVDVSDENFESLVVEGSRTRPVVVDFWAEWCGPCRMLGPLLEQLATEYDGKFTLAKADTEKSQQAAAQFSVQSIPAVFAVIDGKVEDYFVGLLPEPQIRAWLDRLTIRGEMLSARQLETSDPAAAEMSYRSILLERPNEIDASLGLARSLIAQDRRDDARAVIASLEGRGYLEPDAQRIKAQLELERDQGDLTALTAAAADPSDLPAQLKLAQGLAGAQRYTEALDICLELVERDRAGMGENARQLMLDIFRLMGPDSEIASNYRRQLTMLLY